MVCLEKQRVSCPSLAVEDFCFVLVQNPRSKRLVSLFFSLFPMSEARDFFFYLFSRSNGSLAGYSGWERVSFPTPRSRCVLFLSVPQRLWSQEFLLLKSSDLRLLFHVKEGYRKMGGVSWLVSPIATNHILQIYATEKGFL